eukprot:1897348-Amphidinium_carterae.3
MAHVFNNGPLFSRPEPDQKLENAPVSKQITPVQRSTRIEVLLKKLGLEFRLCVQDYNKTQDRARIANNQRLILGPFSRPQALEHPSNTPQITPMQRSRLIEVAPQMTLIKRHTHDE